MPSFFSKDAEDGFNHFIEDTWNNIKKYEQSRHKPIAGQPLRFKFMAMLDIIKVIVLATVSIIATWWIISSAPRWF